MRRKISISSIFLAAAVLPASVLAQGAPPNVRALIADADVIVVGTLSSANSSNGSQVNPTIAVERVVKGNVASGTVLPVVFPPSGDPNCAGPSGGSSIHAIWFLVPAAGGGYGLSPSLRWQLCDPIDSSFETPTALPQSEWSYQASASNEDKLAYELAWSIAAHQGDGPWAFINNPFLFDGATDAAARDIYSKLEALPFPHAHLGGVLGLVGLGDAAALAYLGGNLPQLLSTPLRTTGMADGQSLPITYGANGTDHPTYERLFVQAIRRIASQSSPTISALGRLLASPSVSAQIRRAAAYTLQNIHTAQAVQELAPMLADSDQTIRAYAVGGLACFANGVQNLNAGPFLGSYGPELNNTSPYKTHDTLTHFAMGVQTISAQEDYYVSFWSQWWSENAAAVADAANN
jgi:hypothetical protein